MSMNKYNNLEGKNDRSPLGDLQYVLETSNPVDIYKIMTDENKEHHDVDYIKGNEYKIDIERGSYKKQWIIRFSKSENFTDDEKKLMSSYLTDNKYNHKITDNLVIVTFDRNVDITPLTLDNSYVWATYKTLSYVRMVAYSLFYTLDTLSVERPDDIMYWANPNFEK